MAQWKTAEQWALWETRQDMYQNIMDCINSNHGHGKKARTYTKDECAYCESCDSIIAGITEALSKVEKATTTETTTEQDSNVIPAVSTVWTIADLAHMTEKAIIMDTIDDNEYCEHCTVAPVQIGDTYCAACLDMIIADMAAQWQEDTACSEGTYGTV